MDVSTRNKDIDVLVVGSCNVDLVSYTEKVPKPGETVLGQGFYMANGGKGGNQAAMIGLLGGKVCMVARVGDDYFGNVYKEQLKKYGVDITSILTTPNVHTGVASIIVSKLTGENQIVLSGGANNHLCIDDFGQPIESLISRAKVVAVQLEVNRNVSLHALKLAKKYGAITIFNTAPAYPDLDPEFFHNTDIICFNETEGEILSNQTVDINNGTNELSLLHRILDLGPKSAIFTKGKYGATLIFASNRSVRYNINTEAKDCVVVDTTGAGDCFIGSLAYSIAQNFTEINLPINNILTPKAVQRAVNIASLSVQKIGAQTSYPSIDEIPSDYLS